MEVLEELSKIGIVPVVALDNADQALDLADALVRGGLPAAEITFRTAAGQEAIRRVAKERPDVLVGAGTVLTVKQCDEAIEAGAKFIVSPGYFDDVVNHCIEKGIPVLPGCATASDMTKAVNAGLKNVKFFPAEQAGGIAYLKALAPVFPLNFMPTGGVNTGNVNDYLSFNRILACGGTWMVKKDMINEGRFDEITAICKDAVRQMLGFSLAHVGIAHDTPEEGSRTAKALSEALGLEYIPKDGADFVGTFVESMKKPYFGTRGHIGFHTNHIGRAMYHLGKRGIEFEEASKTYDAKGNLKCVYLKGEFGGFGIHLLQK